MVHFLRFGQDFVFWRQFAVGSLSPQKATAACLFSPGSYRIASVSISVLRHHNRLACLKYFPLLAIIAGGSIFHPEIFCFVGVSAQYIVPQQTAVCRDLFVLGGIIVVGSDTAVVVVFVSPGLSVSKAACCPPILCGDHKRVGIVRGRGA